jgi:endonuclease-8
LPEGDTIHRAARTLHEALAGSIVTRFETVLPALARVDDATPLRGRRIERVTARGKHLLIHLEGPLVLRSHLRMNGSWHIYRAGERWKKPRIDMRIVIATGAWVAVGFNIPVAEFVNDPDRHRDLRALGPDLLGETFDLAEALARMRERNDREIGEALLNQRIAAGIGNVYKSELLFVRNVNPFVRVGALDDAVLERLLTTARKLLQHNVARSGGGRETRSALRGGERLWVYGRRGRPCRRCGTTIEMRPQGSDARVTFWCPRCQPAPAAGGE